MIRKPDHAQVGGEQKNRVFYALEQLHVLPSVNYLAKVRNTSRDVGVPIVEHHSTPEEKTEPAKESEKLPTGH
jgi:molybdopterin-containing oxidoreductase family iron-sulfur binding subunit